MLLTIPLVIDDRDAFSATFLGVDGPIVGFRPDASSTLVSVDVNRWLLAEDGQPTVEAVTRFVERGLGLR